MIFVKKADPIAKFLGIMEVIATWLGWILIVLGLFFFELPGEGHF